MPSPTDEEWNKAVDCAASQFESYWHNDELKTPQQRRAAIDDALQHAWGLLSLTTAKGG
jgi:hypothetical protein